MSEETSLHDQVINALKMVYDPEIPVNIYDLGLIYAINIDDSHNVHIQMTLTTPGCPVAETFPQQISDAVNQVDAVNATQVELVWDPPWSVERMSEAAKLQLGMFG